MAGIGTSLQGSWQRLTQAEPKPPRAWEWVTGLPKGATRAEVVLPEVAGPTLAAVLPQWHLPELQLASTDAGNATYRIAAVNGTPVSDCNQLHAAATRALARKKNITVALADKGGKPGTSMSVDPPQLLALTQAAAAHTQLLRVTEGGNPWVVVRQGGVRCKLMARIERERGILQMALGLTVCWGAQMELPREVTATCDGVPLCCLSAAETLERLYGKSRSTPAAPPAEACSFAAVSEREDYRIPTNYKRLQQATDGAAAGSTMPAPGPALATLPGVPYPGPAVLGDARALSGFLQQRQLHQAGELERVGWIIFAGEALRRGSVIDIAVDLGQGPLHVSLVVPKG
jgi:hypothetical protein